MFPPETVVYAALRWLRLLRTSTLGQASSIIRADARYTDLTQTQYESGLDWLRTLELLIDGPQDAELSPVFKQFPDGQLNQLVFARGLERAEPAWLPDSDVLVLDATELPQDATSFAGTLGLSDQVALMAIRQVHGHIDLAERARIGAAGERALLALLERRWPGSTTHVAETGDGFGYDLSFRYRNRDWHLEVKATTRRGRLVIYLSRHEHEVSLGDPYWRLIVVGLDDQLRPQAVATARHSELVNRAPYDRCKEAKWQSTSYQLTSEDLERGVNFLKATTVDAVIGTDRILCCGESETPSRFSWMPHIGLPFDQ